METLSNDSVDVPYGLLLQLHDGFRSDEEDREEVVPGAVPEKAKKSKRRKDPSAPKKAKSAYSFFMQEARSSVTEAHPDKSFGEVSKLVSDRWKSLTDEQKLRFEDLARTDKERYHQEMQDYNPPDDNQNGSVKKRKRRRKDPSAPKKNSSAFLFFSQDARPKVRNTQPELSTTDISKVLGLQWKTLPPEEREQFVDAARRDKERYEREMQSWNAKKAVKSATSSSHSPMQLQPARTHQQDNHL